MNTIRNYLSYQHEEVIPFKWFLLFFYICLLFKLGFSQIKYENITNEILDETINRIALKLDFIIDKKDSSYYISRRVTGDHYAIVDYYVCDDAICIKSKAFNRIRYYFDNEKIRKVIDNEPLNKEILQAIDQEILGEKSIYYSIKKQKYANPITSVSLTLIDPAIGSFYSFNQHYIDKKIKWIFFMGIAALFDLPSYSLVMSDNKKLRYIGIGGMIFDRMIGGLISYSMIKDGNRLKNSGYKFDFSKAKKKKLKKQ